VKECKSFSSLMMEWCEKPDECRLPTFAMMNEQADSNDLIKLCGKTIITAPDAAARLRVIVLTK
jgi:hypothetical protein